MERGIKLEEGDKKGDGIKVENWKTREKRKSSREAVERSASAMKASDAITGRPCADWKRYGTVSTDPFVPDSVFFRPVSRRLCSLPVAMVSSAR